MNDPKSNDLDRSAIGTPNTPNSTNTVVRFGSSIFFLDLFIISNPLSSDIGWPALMTNNDKHDWPFKIVAGRTTGSSENVHPVVSVSFRGGCDSE
ncbi:hypothetical protein J6590_097023 [Homalodisca vitripennis]|nr:hypothetical protein J6590_097023 [Homalodisca vitripennis]